MRQRFEQQLVLGATPIGETKFPLRSRDELPPVLKAFQDQKQVFFLLLCSKLI